VSIGCNAIKVAAIPTVQSLVMTRSGLALFVADFFQPVNDFAVERFLNRDVRHGCGWRGAVPVLLAGRKPDDVPRPDFLNRAAPALCAPAASRDNQGLTQRMCVPSGAGARLKCNDCAVDTRRIGSLKRRVDARGAGEPI
jgi:hypothetical protein